MSLIRQPGEHSTLGEEWGPHDYLIAEHTLFEAATLPPKVALIRLRLCLTIFMEYGRDTDPEESSGIPHDDYRCLLGLLDRSIVALAACEPESYAWKQKLRLVQRIGLLLLSMSYDYEDWYVGDPPDYRRVGKLMFPGIYR